jgi:hypothetical protein
MTETIDRLIQARFDAAANPLDDADWTDVLARARGATHFHAFTHLRTWRRRTTVAVGVAVLAAAGAASALAYHYLGPSPGFTAGLSSLDSLPRASWPSSLPRDALDHAAAATGLTPGEAAQRLRLAQTGLSLGRENVKGISLYAFEGNSGTGCLFITGPDSGGICLPSWATGNSALDGVAFAVGGGNSRATPGPMAVYGLVADNVRQVETDISGVVHDVPIVNNSFYAEYDRITGTETIKLIVHFDDGSTRTFHSPNPYGDNGPTRLLPSSSSSSHAITR